MARRIGGLAVVLLGGLAAAGCSGADGSPPGTSPASTLRRVAVDHPRPAAGYEVQRTFSGRVETARSATLGFEIGGLIEAVLVDEGDGVSMGETLARLDTARLDASRRELLAALARARSQAELAASTLARVQEAVDYRGVSTQERDRALDARNRAVAAVALAEARLASLDVQLEKSVLRAPFAGTVARRLQDEGNVLSPGTPLVVLEETGRLRARVGIAGSLADRLTVGARQTLTGSSGPLDARVLAVLPVRDPVTRTVDVVLALTDATAAPVDTGVRAGDLVSLSVREFRPLSGYWLPLASLSEGERGLWSVLVTRSAPAGGTPLRLERRLVEVRHQTETEVFVTGGIDETDYIVSGGTHRVVAGQRVTPVVSGAARAPHSRVPAARVPPGRAPDGRFAHAGER